MVRATSVVRASQTSIHPAMREAIFTVETTNPQAAQRVREFLDGYSTSVCYNHHSPEEPNWRDQSWGTHYTLLEAIKKTHDRNHRFNVYHGVGYSGNEFGDAYWNRLWADGCPWRNGTNLLSIPTRIVAWLRDQIFY